jgi:hypothetical protein
VQDGHVVGGPQHLQHQHQHHHQRNGKREQVPGPGEQLVLDVAPTGVRR